MEESTPPVLVSRGKLLWWRWIAVSAVTSGIWGLLTVPTPAQLIPDHTLGAESSVVNELDTVTQRIDGGAIRGSNLFHSFNEFNVAENHTVYFANPAGIDSILSRITGNNPSNVFGRLGVLGNADLFLINPHGFVFGENATLDVNGAFHAIAAPELPLENGVFSAVAPQSNSLLTISPDVSLFNYLTARTGDITNSGTLAIGVAETLTLFGNTTLNRGSLIAPGGTVQLLGDRIALVDQAIVDVSGNNGGGTVLIGGDYQGQGTIPTADRTFVGTDAIITADALQNGDGGRVTVWADDATSFAGTISAQGGSESGNGGFVEVSGAASLNFAGTVNTQAPHGSNGQLLLDPTNITIANAAPVGFTTVGVGNAALADFLYADTEDDGKNSHLTPATVLTLLALNDLTLEATDTITVVDDTINVLSDNTLTLQANRIQVNASLRQFGGGDLVLITPQTPDSAVVIDGPTIASNVPPGATLAGGDVRITTQDLSVLNGADISASTFGNGNSGRVEIVAAGNVVVDGTDSSIGSQVGPAAQGDSGGVAISANNLSVRNDGQISASTFGGGDAGQVEIVASGNVVVDGTGSSIGSQVGPTAQGNSGGVAITANNLSVLNAAQISASTFGEGDAGRVGIATLGDVVVDGTDAFIGSQVASSARGDSGGLIINARNLSVLNVAAVSASTAGEGNAGPVEIVTNGTVTVANRSFIGSQVGNGSSGQGDSGGVAITAQNLSLSGGSAISSSILRNGTAGDISIQSPRSTDLRITLDDGLIAAGTNSSARGGNVVLSASGTLTLQGNGRVTVESAGANTGRAGNLNVSAGSVILEGDIELSAQTASVQGGGNVNFFVDSAIIMRRGSFINAESTNVAATSDGGNITLITDFLTTAPNENNDIVANAVGGTGGRIRVTALGIYGFTEQTGFTTSALRVNGSSDISASSQFGQDGPIDAISVIVDPNEGLNALGDTFVSPDDLISSSCIARGNQVEGSFSVIGAGGLPNIPGDSVNSIYVTGDVQDLPIANNEPNPESWQLGNPIVEPDTVAQLADGRLVFGRSCNS